MSKPLTRPILERSRALIADKSHWCRGSLARDVGGRQVDPWDPVADVNQARDLADAVEREIHGTSWLITTNDIGGHRAVLALFDQVLAL